MVRFLHPPARCTALLVLWLITMAVFVLFFVAPQQRRADARPAGRRPRRRSP